MFELVVKRMSSIEHSDNHYTINKESGKHFEDMHVFKDDADTHEKDH